MYIKNGRYDWQRYNSARSYKKIIEDAQDVFYRDKTQEKEKMEKYLRKLATEIILSGEDLTGIRNLIKRTKRRKQIKQFIKKMNGGFEILIDEFCKARIIAHPRNGSRKKFKEIFLYGVNPVALGGELKKANFNEVIDRAILEIIKSSKRQSRKVGRFALDYIGGNMTDDDISKNIKKAGTSAEKAEEFLNDAANLAQVLNVTRKHKKEYKIAGEMAKVARGIANVNPEDRDSYIEQLDNSIKGSRIKVGKYSLNPFIKGSKKLAEKSADDEAETAENPSNHEEH